MNVLITLSTAGASTGPTFNLYSDVDTYAAPFETGVAKSALLAGYTSTVVPNAATMIRVQSVGACTNYGLFAIAGVTTTTTTTSGGGGTTTTTTTTATPTTTTTTTGGGPTTTTTTTQFTYQVWNLYRSEGAEYPACSTTPASLTIPYSVNYAPGVVFKASNGLCYTIANSGFQVSAPTITLSEEFGTCTECSETSVTTTTTTTIAPPVYYTFNITGGYPTSEDACLEGSSVREIYGYNVLFLDNAIFYDNTGLTIPYDGSSLYYKNTATNQWSRISNTGDNIEEGNC